MLLAKKIDTYGIIMKNYNYVNLFSVIKNAIFCKLHGKNIVACQKTYIRNPQNINTNAPLVIGINHVKYKDKDKATYINVEGSLIIENRTSIARGASINIGKNANVILDGCSIGASNLIINHCLKIGKGSLISWDCEFIDNNMHHLIVNGVKENKNKGIIIGTNVWIGSGCRILPDVIIGDNCVVAAGSIVTKPFPVKNCLIAGVPAKIIAENISWEV